MWGRWVAVALVAMVVAGLGLSPPAAASVLVLEDVQVYEGEVAAVVYNGTVSLAANGTESIAVVPPAGNISDWDYIIVEMRGANGTVRLSATLNGSTVFDGTVTPLASGETVLQLPVADNITLLATNAWGTTLTVKIVAGVKFQVEVVSSTVVEAKPGGEATVNLSVTQVDGPPVYTWWTVDYGNAPLDDVRVYYVNPSAYPAKFIDWTGWRNSLRTSGAGFDADGTVRITVSDSASEGDRYYVNLGLWYQFTDPDEDYGASAQLAAEVALGSGNGAGDGSTGQAGDGDDGGWLTPGAVALVLVGIGAFLLGGFLLGGKR